MMAFTLGISHRESVSLATEPFDGYGIVVPSGMMDMFLGRALLLEQGARIFTLCPIPAMVMARLEMWVFTPPG